MSELEKAGKRIEELHQYLEKSDLELKTLREENGWLREALQTSKIFQENQRFREALEFYADPETYYAIGFFPDHPCGPFYKDVSETHLGRKPGAKARKALEREKCD